MQYFEGDVMATVSYAVLDPDSGQLRISSAGHLPPVIAAPGQRGAMAEIAVDPPIGVTDAPVRQVTTLALAPGAVLCLFTDGLVERRDEPIDDGITLLCQAVTPDRPRASAPRSCRPWSEVSTPGMTSPFWYCAGCATRRTRCMPPLRRVAKAGSPRRSDSSAPPRHLVKLVIRNVSPAADGAAAAGSCWSTWSARAATSSSSTWARSGSPAIAGLGVLVGGLKRVRARDGSLDLVCTQQRILKIFRITGLTEVFGIYETVDQAIAAKRGRR